LHADRSGLVKIEAIICSKGNTSVENVCRNVVRLLEAANRTDIPVYRGSHHHLSPSDEELNLFHGDDGLGNLSYATDVNVETIKNEIWITALYNLVKSNPQEISLICLGPLTSAAIPMIIYEDFASSLKEIYIMGGNYTGSGNITDTAEFNFYCDPEAANVIFHHAKCPMVMVPWECCKRSQIPFKWRFEAVGTIGGPVWQIINRAERAVYKDVEDSASWMPCDAFLAFVFLYGKEAIVKSREVHISVELHGVKTRGQVVLGCLDKNNHNVTLVECVEESLFQNVLLEICANI